jgi:hypothetical protein
VYSRHTVHGKGQWSTHTREILRHPLNRRNLQQWSWKLCAGIWAPLFWRDLVHFLLWPITGLLGKPRMIDEYEAFDETRIGKGNRSTRIEPAPCHFVHYKSHMTWAGIETWSPPWEAGDWPSELWHSLSWPLHPDANTSRRLEQCLPQTGRVILTSQTNVGHPRTVQKSAIEMP